MPYSLIRECPTCSAKNRVPARHLASTVRCGACKTTLGAASIPLDVDTDAFDEIVREVRVPVLVDFWAAWCGPCSIAAPHVQELARQMTGRAIVLKVDTEGQPDLAARFGIRAIPNFIVLKDGRTVRQQTGLAPRAEMQRWLEDAARNA